MYRADQLAAAAHLLEDAAVRGLMIATAESCTGGLIAGLLTDIPGSSVAFERGFVTYSNDAKAECLGVPADLLLDHGAVSAPVARAMAHGALAHAHADVAVSVTGIAGPGGGTADKPVGLVHIAAAGPDGVLLHEEMRYGDLGRSAIREATMMDAIGLLRALIRRSCGKVHS